MHRTVIVSLVVLSIPSAGLAQSSYLCSKVSLEERITATQKTLEDSFGARVVDVRSVAFLCNAALSSADPGVHQVAYKMTAAKDVQQTAFERTDRVVSDEFGEHAVSLVKPAGLLAPSAVVHGGGGASTIDTTGVDHFQCYKAARSRGAEKFLPPPAFGVEDSLGQKTIQISKISKICTPANINGEDLLAPYHDGHLVCYRARLVTGSMVGILSVNNTSFGPSIMYLKSMTEYCVPATMTSAP
jgi:hypothetical protein